ncbi:MAG: hypothetical protein V4579_02195 [Pseudomonadota bacterium]
MLRFVILSVAVTLALPQIAAAAPTAEAAETVCLTRREFTALSTYALPSLIRGTARACAEKLPTDSYLRTQGDALAVRYTAGKARAWPEARAAFLKMSLAGTPEMADVLGAMPDDSLQQMTDAAMAGVVSGKVKPSSCGTIDRITALLAPLPAESTAELVALVGLGSRADGARIGKIALCTA